MNLNLTPLEKVFSSGNECCCSKKSICMFPRLLRFRELKLTSGKRFRILRQVKTKEASTEGDTFVQVVWSCDTKEEEQQR